MITFYSDANETTCIAQKKHSNQWIAVYFYYYFFYQHSVDRKNIERINKYLIINGCFAS